MRLPELPNEAAALTPPPLLRPVALPEPKPERVLIWDVERAPARSLHYGIWDININRTGLEMEPWIYCFAAKWRGEDEMQFHAVWDQPTPSYAEVQNANLFLVERAWAVLNEADVVVSFNGKRSDTRWIGNEFTRWGMSQPAGFREIDLFQQFKRHTDLPFKGMDDICRHLGIEGKLKVDLRGIELYRQAVEKRDPIAQGKAKAYNMQDVRATEAILDWMEEREWL